MAKKLFTLLTLIMLCVTTATFTACSDDDEKNESTTSSIVGRWTDGDGEYFVFNSNSTGVYTSVENGKIEESYFTWSLSGKLLSLYVVDGDETDLEIFTITELTSSTLIMKDEDGDIWTYHKE